MIFKIMVFGLEAVINVIEIVNYIRTIRSSRSKRGDAIGWGNKMGWLHATQAGGPELMEHRLGVILSCY